MEKLRLIAVIGIAGCLSVPAGSSEPLDLETVTRIRDQGLKHSQVMDTAEHLTTVIGPRLTGSPAMKAAADWAVETMKSWGIEAAYTETFEFGRGWTFSRAAVHMVEPHQTPLIALPRAWSPGTAKPRTGEVVRVDLDSAEDLEEQKGKLAGKIVFMEEAREIEPPETEPFRRHDQASLEEIEQYEIRLGGTPEWRKKRKERREFSKLLIPWLEEEKVLATVTQSGWDAGILRMHRGGSSKVGDPQGVPQLTMAAEHYNRVVRLLDKDIPVNIEIDIEANFIHKEVQGINVIAEIPGTDPDAGIVMAGAHLDSWHTGTGATDNAGSCAAIMESLRILHELGVRPRRTIRIALWDGEEQGLLGSKAYVERHFAARPDPEDPEQLELPPFRREPTWPIEPRPDHAGLAAYFNMDNGGGKIRGIRTQENAAVVPIFEAWLKPFNDLGAGSVSMRTTGSTDHIPFDQVGLPGFQFIQEPLHYFSWTHHSNIDTFDHLQEADLRQASVVIASFLYHAAMREEPLPRKPLPTEPKED